MRRTPPHRRHPRRFAPSFAAAALLLAATGCGSEPTAEEADPALGSILTRVDESVVERDWEQAREDLRRLVARTSRAEEAGTLTKEQARRIQAAAARLLTELPDPPPPPPPPAPPAEPETDDAEDHEKEDEEEDDEDED